MQTKTQAELDEEESLQLALAMSQSEAEDKERQKKMLTQKYAMSSFLSAPADNNPPVIISHFISFSTIYIDQNVPENNNEYAELTKYIEKGHQQQQQHEKFNPTNVSNGHGTGSISQLPVNKDFYIGKNILFRFFP